MTPSTDSQIDGRFDDGTNPADLSRPIKVDHGRPPAADVTPDDPYTYQYTYRELHEALSESLRLQAHYAKLLNAWDSGARVSFTTVDAWIARLREMGRFPALREPDHASSHA